jgi:catechol 2,3-dioxygenase-like lactoylglutathione lyase family enzyme
MNVEVPEARSSMARLQLALNVNDLDEAVVFYSKLFGTEPAKRRDGYANFAIAEPPLKLVLLEHPGQGGSLNHQTRLAAAGLVSVDERATTCCYAKQDKFWVQGSPDGESWEVYTVLEDSPAFYGEEDSPACCRGTGRESGDAASVPVAPCC